MRLSHFRKVGERCKQDKEIYIMSEAMHLDSSSRKYLEATIIKADSGAVREVQNISVVDSFWREKRESKQIGGRVIPTRVSIEVAL